jgi:hypothetical protein
VAGGTRSGAVTPSSSAQASNLWRNSARTIGDILVLSDITNPFNYFTLPFVNQAFFVAGCCYIKGEFGLGSALLHTAAHCYERTVAHCSHSFLLSVGALVLCK